jgi:DNA-binding NtrC family response regulator
MSSNSTKRPILIVDDEPEMLHSLRNLLRHDYQVFTASSGPEGLKILETELIQLVMTDQRMPEMTGVELLKHVKNEHPGAIRIIFTGYADMKAVIAAINQGNVFRFVTKPWEPEELLAALREAGEHHDRIVGQYHLLDDLAHHEIECGQFKDALLTGQFGALTTDGAATAVRLLNINRELIDRLQQTLAAATHQPI